MTNKGVNKGFLTIVVPLIRPAMNPLFPHGGWGYLNHGKPRLTSHDCWLANPSGVFPKIGVPGYMDGENSGKSYEQMDDLG